LTTSFCDERFSLQTTFIVNLWQAPWGGRLIRFDYADCNPAITNHFGSFAGSNASSPHNVLLDIYNDTGLIPSSLMLLSLSFILPGILGRLFAMYRSNASDWHASIRWGFFSVFSVQFLSQPFMYSDQLMFSVAFLFLGVILAEASDGRPSSLVSLRRQ